MFGCSNHRPTICVASSAVNRSPGSFGFVVIRRKAVIVCQGNPTGAVPENVDSSQLRARLWREGGGAGRERRGLVGKRNQFVSGPPSPLITSRTHHNSPPRECPLFCGGSQSIS